MDEKDTMWEALGWGLFALVLLLCLALAVFGAALQPVS